MLDTNLSPHPQKIVFLDQDFKLSIVKKGAEGYDKNFHEELEIKCFYEGTSAMMIDGEVHTFNAGDIAIVNPYEIHTSVNIDKFNGKYYLVILDLDFLAKDSVFGVDLRKILLSDGEKFASIIKNDIRLENLIVNIYKELAERQERYKQMVYSLINEFFIILLRDYKTHKTQNTSFSLGSKTAELIAPALAKIFKDYSKNITIEELANLCGVSKYHFCRVFKKEMKVTIIEYLNNYRLSVAEIMLKNIELTTEEIALSCGFNDVSYFYRCYKKVKQKPLRRKALK